MTAQEKVISVIGATGQQGGSVARSLLQNPDFKVRCITRNGESEQAKALRSLGAEIVQADGESCPGMTAALAGSWGVFINLLTELYPDETAIRLGANIVRAAEAAGVKHVVFSSAPPASQLTNGKVYLSSLDVKATIEAMGQDSPAFQTFTPVMVGWYLECIGESCADLYGGFPVREDAEGILTCSLPRWGGNEKMPWISIAHDFGDIIHGIFLNPLRWNRRLIQCHGELLSAADMTTTFSAVTGKKTRYVSYINIDDMKPGIFEGVQKMFMYTQMRDGEYYPNGIAEVETAAMLKKDACKAKKFGGREILMTVKEYFQREFGKVV